MYNELNCQTDLQTSSTEVLHTAMLAIRTHILSSRHYKAIYLDQFRELLFILIFTE